MEIPQNFACLLITYHMENCLWLRQFDQSIFRGVIALFDIEYFIKMDMYSIFLIGIPEKIACLLIIIMEISILLWQ